MSSTAANLLKRWLCGVLCTRGFTWWVLLWNLFCFTREPPCPLVSRVVVRLRCFFYLSRVCGICFFILVVVAMGSKWSFSLESTRPPDGSTRFIFVGARRVFASSKNTCYLPGHRSCFSHCSHPGHLVHGRLLVKTVSEALVVWWCHSLEGSFSGFLPRWLLWRWNFFCCKNISERRRNGAKWCKKRICDAPDLSSLLANKSFLSECF